MKERHGVVATAVDGKALFCVEEEWGGREGIVLLFYRKKSIDKFFYTFI